MDETNTEIAQPTPHPSDTKGERLETKTIGISGMTCAECVKKIDKAFRGKHGVKKVEVNRDDATAMITFDSRQTNLPELHDVLLKSGYKPVGGVVP